jgi:hypothetical protein
MEEDTIINIRKLAALDITLHGPFWILIEFFLGVFLIAAISLLVFYSGQILLGIYIMFLALNYVPILIYAILIVKHKSARKEVKVEMSNLGRYGRKYNVQQFFIFVPLAIIILAILQELQKR